MTEFEKMLAGELYNPADDKLYTVRTIAHRLCQEYNKLYDTEEEERGRVMRQLIPQLGEDSYIQGPIYVDYGMNIVTGKNFYANFNLTILDVCPVYIGDNVMCGNNVSILTPMHPLKWQERNARIMPDGSTLQLEYAKPIHIGSNCWIAGNVTIIGGVNIGDGCVIGAGSVVTRDIPANSLAAGVPCRVIRQIQ